MGRSRQCPRVRVLVVPFDSNPYQEQLYAPMRAAHPNDFQMAYWHRLPWVGLPLFFVMALWAAIAGYRIVHIHWLAWDLRLQMPGRARVSGMISRSAIRWLKLLRFRIVWTVHNVLPHEPQTDDDRAIARLLADSADVLIVHSSAVRKTLALQGIPDDGAVVIPQGSYIGHYRPAPSQADARRALGVPEDGRVLLFFGLIRSYKGIPELLKAWSETAPPGTLLIAGACSDPSLQAAIRASASEDPSVHGHLRFIPDGEVPTFFAASDGVCLPFRTVTTSSTALMALSFGKPLIAPRIGALEDLPEDVGFFYGDGTGSTLGDALDRFSGASEAELENASRSALEYAEQLSWPALAARTFGVYASVSPSTHS